MKTWDNVSCPSKALIRPELFAVGNRFKKRTAKTFVCNPADLCLCIKEALKQGIIDTDTKILAIERGSQTIINSILKKTSQMGFKNVTIWNKDIIKLTANNMRQLGFGHVDYAYLDTCSCLTEAFITWYKRHMNKVINYKSTLAFTFMISRDVRAWKNYKLKDNDSIYMFCNPLENFERDKKKLYDANQVSKLIMDNTKFKTTVTYGRTYKEPGISQPMITFKLNFGWKQSGFSGNRKTLNLGYN